MGLLGSQTSLATQIGQTPSSLLDGSHLQATFFSLLDLYLDQSPWNSLVVWMQEVVLPDGSSPQST